MKTILSLLLLLCLPLIWSCGGDDDDADDDATPVDDDTAAVDDDTASADDDAVDDDTGARAQVILPDYPFWPNNAYVIDLELLEDLATAYCAAHPDDASAEDFFYGELALASFDWFYADEGQPKLEALMGDFYISGFFGGLWLKQALNPAKDERRVDFLRLTFQAMAGYTAAQIETSEQATDGEVCAAARRHVGPQVFIYAYNLGYLEEILAHPPAGSPSLADLLVCQDGQLLDCDSPEMDWAFLDRYDAAIAKLRQPPTGAWQELAALTENAEVFVAQGHAVWQRISLEHLDPEGYRLLVRLSLNFLLASKVAALGHMTAWADTAPGDGRDSLLTDAGMITWAGSYFMGLAARDATGEFPQLICP